MFKFKKGRRKDFKTDTAFLKDVYQKNLGRLPAGETESKFVANVIAHKVTYKTNITGALNIYARNREYTPYEELAVDNIMSGLKKHGMFKKFKTMIRDRSNKFRAFDPKKLSWDASQKVYIYDNTEYKIIIDRRESPERITLRITK